MTRKRRRAASAEEIADRLFKIESQLLKAAEANDMAMYLLNELHLFLDGPEEHADDDASGG